MFGLNLKYIILLILAVIVVVSIIKKLFKLAIFIGVLVLLYYLYRIFIA